MSFAEIFKDFIEKDRNREVIKSIPAKKEWIESYKEVVRLSEEAKIADRKWQFHKDKFWADISIELNDYINDFRMNEKTNEIEILGEKNKDNPIKSPIQII